MTVLPYQIDLVTLELNDEAAAEFCRGIYVALLSDLKNSLE